MDAEYTHSLHCCSISLIKETPFVGCLSTAVCSNCSPKNLEDAERIYPTLNADIPPNFKLQFFRKTRMYKQHDIATSMYISYQF
jgi:hypothetical protein